MENKEGRYHALDETDYIEQSIRNVGSRLVTNDSPIGKLHVDAAYVIVEQVEKSITKHAIDKLIDMARKLRALPHEYQSVLINLGVLEAFGEELAMDVEYWVNYFVNECFARYQGRRLMWNKIVVRHRVNDILSCHAKLYKEDIREEGERAERSGTEEVS
jgi:hypothetical protein